jgi:beta-lactamase regulating signal transducer with metallopeptidase domain
MLVLAVQWLFRRRLNARWQYALWLLVVVRLAMPSLPASSWSVFNVVHYAKAATALPRAASDVQRPTVSVPVSTTITEAQSTPENVNRGRVALPPDPIADCYEPHKNKDRIDRNLWSF